MSSQKSEILHFDGLLLSKSYKVPAKKSTEELSLMKFKSDAKFKENWIVVLNMTWRTSWVFTQPLKSLKISLRWAHSVQSIWKFEIKNTEELSFMTLNSDAKFE